MGVPNTNTFTLADVVAVVNPTTNDLQDCFSDASTASFNTTYDENKDQLDDFRDYGNNGSSQSLVYIANNNYTNANVCTQSQSFSCYKSGAATIFENGNKIWYNTLSGPGGPFVGNAITPDLEWYSGGSGVSKVKFQINPSGVIYNVEACNPYRTLPGVQYVTSYTNTGAWNWSTAIDCYYDNLIGDAENLTPGDIIYTDTTLLSPLTANPGPMPLRFFQWNYTATSTDICQDSTGSPGAHIVLTNSTDGVISTATCSYL